MAENRLISNLEGILYYLDIPLLDFSVRNRQLVRAVNLSQSRLYPPELALYGISYGNLNEFFERRTMKEHSMFYREHLKAIGMEDVLISRGGQLAVRTDRLDCDYYRFKELDGGAVNAYQNEYMSQYSWADFLFDEDLY